MKKFLNKCIAILWTVFLSICIVACAIGVETTWLMIFAPIILIVWDKWGDVFTDLKKDKDSD